MSPSRWVPARSGLPLLWMLVFGFAPAAARADDTPTPPPRPSEDALFGEPPPAEAPRASEDALFGAPTDAAAPEAEAPRASEEASLFGDAQLTTPSDEAAPDDPLAIGGLFYMRFAGTHREGQALKDVAFSLPTLLDVYLDSRPNDRLRAYTALRMTTNPLPSESVLLLSPTSLEEAEETSFSLQQLWLRTDAGHRVFITAGKQFVKWGPSRFWNPTDFLQPVRRDPLAFFDVRGGVTMLKLHLPWEAKGWNLYGIALMDQVMVPEADPDDEDPQVLGTLENIGAAARAEIVLGTVEIGIDGLAQRDRNPRLGLDFSAGVGPLDVYGEASLQRGPYQATYELDADGELVPADIDTLTTAASGGLSWSTVVRDNDNLTLGGEYFYNPLGYDDPALYLDLFAVGGYLPFYLGKQYGAVFALLSSPGTWDDTSFTLSTLGNLSDKSFVTRLDATTLVRTHLRLEMYAAYHYGTTGGEFHQSIEIPADPPFIPEAISIPAPMIDVGLNLRVAI